MAECTHPTAAAGALRPLKSLAGSSLATARGERRPSTATWEATLAVKASSARRQSSGSSAAVAATLGRLLRLPSRASARQVALAWAAKRLAPVRALCLPGCCLRACSPTAAGHRGERCRSAAALREPDARPGCADVPPFKLAQMMAQADDKSSAEYQRLTWDALRKSINGLVNKVSAARAKC